jgi:hypothetical protein
MKIFLGSGETESRLTEIFFSIIAHLRRFCIYSVSNLFNRFDLFLRRFGMNILISDIDKFRQKGRYLN